MAITKEVLVMLQALPKEEKAALNAAIKEKTKLSIESFKELSPLGKAAVITAWVTIIGLGIYWGLKLKDYMSYRQHKAEARGELDARRDYL